MTDAEARVRALENKVEAIQARLLGCELHRTSTLDQLVAQSWTWGLTERMGVSAPALGCLYVPFTLQLSLTNSIGTYSGAINWNGTIWTGQFNVDVPAGFGCPAASAVPVTWTLDPGTPLLKSSFPATGACPDPAGAGTGHETYNYFGANISCSPYNSSFSESGGSRLNGGLTMGGFIHA